MIYSAKLSAKILKHIISNRCRGNYKFPFVLMLEPLFKCNLNCSGCGRIREYRDILNEKLSVEQCIKAADQAKAPIISITGGEPLLHPQITDIVNELLKRKYFVYLCTNGLLLYDFLDEIKPENEFSIVVHLDGLSENHYSASGSKNVFDSALKGIKKAVKLKFKVRTNTTIYSYTDIREISSLFSNLMDFGTQGVIVSPAFSYESINDRDNKLFLNRQQSYEKFEQLYSCLDGTRVYNTPLYWELLRGKRELQCIPWANPTYNPKGWKSPCYLITDTHFPAYDEFIKNTPWEKYGVEKDTRCKNCLMHSGFEASAILSMKIKDLFKIVKWNFTGKIR